MNFHLMPSDLTASFLDPNQLREATSSVRWNQAQLLSSQNDLQLKTALFLEQDQEYYLEIQR